MGREVLQGNLVLTITDDSYPDCFVQELQLINIEFDNTNPCSDKPKIDNIDDDAAESCEGLLSGDSCVLTCKRHFEPSAETLKCIDGEWEDLECKEEGESYLEYMVLPIGGGLSLVIIAAVAWRQDMAMDALVSFMKDTFILCASITFEFMDIISDLVVLITIYSNDDLEHYLIYYALFFGTGSVMFLCHIFVNAIYLFRLFTKADMVSWDLLTTSVKTRQKKLGKASRRRKKVEGRTLSVGLDKNGNVMSLRNLKGLFIERSHTAMITEARINRIMGLMALLVFEDFPMMIMNILIVNEYRGEASRVPILLSMTVGNLMVAFKASAAYSITTLKELLHQQQSGCMDLLDEIDRQKKEQKK